MTFYFQGGPIDGTFRTVVRPPDQLKIPCLEDQPLAQFINEAEPPAPSLRLRAAVYRLGSLALGPRPFRGAQGVYIFSHYEGENGVKSQSQS